MSLCINPDCDRAKNQIDQRQELFCSSCGSSLLLNNIYRVLRYLGSGGFGWTYLVDDCETRKVLKILHNTHTKAISLFEQEADVLQKLHHPGIPKVDEGGRFDYFPKRSTKPLRCLVMEYIEGDNLADYLAKQDFQPISEPVAIDWLHELVEILDLVHGAKYFHRDIKPSNIMIRNTGKLALIDFGTAREETQTYLQKQKRQNVTGIVSIGYTPHEQANGRAEYRSDFFALGRTFVFLLTGKEPDEFKETVTKGLVWQQEAQGYSQALRDLIDYLMRPEVTDRPSNTQKILQKIAVFATIKKKTTNILTTTNLHKFLSENKAEKNTLICFRYKDNTVKVEVKSSDFSIAETFDLEEGQTAVSGAIFVKCEEIAKILSALSKSKAEISFELVDKTFSLTPDVSVPAEKIIPNRDRAPHNVMIIKDHALLRWFAQQSVTTGKSQTPPAPYVDGLISEYGCCLTVVNRVSAFEYIYPIAQLAEWGSTSPVKGTNERICIPAIVVAKLNPELDIQIHTGNGTIAIKSGNTAITIERLKDPLSSHLSDQFYEKAGELTILFDEPENSSEPTRMERLVNWAKQTKTTLGDFLVSPSGVWVGPKDFVKPGFKTNPKALQLSDRPELQTLIASVPIKTLVNAIELMGMKNVRISFPVNKGEIFKIQEIDGVKTVCVKAELIEAPSDAIASLPIQELLDETPIEIVQGETTLVEATRTIAEAIQQAIEENKIPEEMKESIQAAQTAIEEGFVEKAEIIEKMDTNIVPLDSGKRRKAQALQQKIKETAKQLKTEMQKDDRDPNLIVKLIWRIETLGGRFIQITFALETHWWPTLTISEEVRKQAKEAYPQLSA